MQSFIQSPAWEQFQKEAGASVIRHDGALYIERPLPFNGTYLQTSRAIFNTFTLPPLSKNCWFIRLEPEDADSYTHIEKFATSNGYRLQPTIAIQPRQTSLVNISPPWETVLQTMRQKHRYNIRVSERHHVEVDTFSSDLQPAFERFWKLLTTTSQRHDFRTHSKAYYQDMLRALEPETMAHILIAHTNDTDLAGMILITYKDTATYLHGGSITTHKEFMAPYALHASAIKYAQSRGCTTYDLWGTHLIEQSGEWVPQEGHASAGTSRFKLGFNGHIVNYPGTFDLILRPFWYTLYQTGRTLVTGKRDFA